jgi:hypothetical protein
MSRGKKRSPSPGILPVAKKSKSSHNNAGIPLTHKGQQAAISEAYKFGEKDSRSETPAFIYTQHLASSYTPIHAQVCAQLTTLKSLELDEKIAYAEQALDELEELGEEGYKPEWTAQMKRSIGKSLARMQKAKRVEENDRKAHLAGSILKSDLGRRPSPPERSPGEQLRNEAEEQRERIKGEESEYARKKGPAIYAEKVVCNEELGKIARVRREKMKKATEAGMSLIDRLKKDAEAVLQKKDDRVLKEKLVKEAEEILQKRDDRVLKEKLAKEAEEILRKKDTAAAEKELKAKLLKKAKEVLQEEEEKAERD